VHTFALAANIRSRRIEEGGGFLTGKNTSGKYETGARLGFEEKLWAAADKMRSYMDPAEYSVWAISVSYYIG
jgi:hypothetical protein